MATVVFPATLAGIQDSKYFHIELEDKAIKGEVEGGYVHARPRHTRPPRKTFTTGFTDITQSQFDALVNFYNQVGTYSKFEYTNPTDGVKYMVMFGKGIKAKYTGAGPTRLYTITDIELKEV